MTLKKSVVEGGRVLVSSGSVFEEKVGYSRVVVEGEWVFVSGTTGYDYGTMEISDDVVVQCEQCLRNIEEALGAVGCGLRDVVRVRLIFPSREDFRLCWGVLRRYFGEVLPANTMFVAGLFDEKMKVEIEVTARRRGG